MAYQKINVQVSLKYYCICDPMVTESLKASPQCCGKTHVGQCLAHVLATKLYLLNE